MPKKDDHTSRKTSRSDAATPDLGHDTLNRRQLLSTAGTLSLGLTAGCLDSVPLVGKDRVPVETGSPENKDDGSPEAFRFLLEKNDITVDELYYDTETADLLLFYESDATDRTESDEEVALIYRVFSEGLVANGSDVNHLYTEVLDRFEGQVEGWGVNSDWAERHLAGEVSDLQVWNQIVTTMVYEEGERLAASGGDDKVVLDDGNGTSETMDTDEGDDSDDPEDES